MALSYISFLREKISGVIWRSASNLCICSSLSFSAIGRRAGDFTNFCFGLTGDKNWDRHLFWGQSQVLPEENKGKIGTVPKVSVPYIIIKIIIKIFFILKPLYYIDKSIKDYSKKNPLWQGKIEIFIFLWFLTNLKQKACSAHPFYKASRGAR